MSLQWVLLLILNLDALEAMDVLSKTHQTSLDIAPYFITYNLLRCKNIINEDIESLDKLTIIINEYLHKQFDPDYNIQTELKSIQYLVNTKEHLSQLCHFRCGSHQLSVNNLLTDFYTDKMYANMDASKFLSVDEDFEIFGENTDYNLDEEDPSSDYVPSETESKENTEEYDEILHEYELRTLTQNTSNT